MPRDIQREKPHPAGIDREKTDQIAADMTGRAHQQGQVEIAETAMAFAHQPLLQALRLAHVAVDGGLGFAQLVQRLLELRIGVAQALFHAQDAFAGRQPRQQFGAETGLVRNSSHASGQRQLWLGQRQLLAGAAQGLAKLFGGVDEGHADQFPDREIIGK